MSKSEMMCDCASCDCCDGGCDSCGVPVSSVAMIGAGVPDFEFDVYQAKKISKRSISDYNGKWLVLFFYPANFTFVCPTELEELQSYYSKMQAEGAEVLSISTDTAFAHKVWHDSSEAIGKVEYGMASDANHQLAEYFNVLIEEEGVALRGTFIIDPDGVLKAMEINDNSIGRSAKELLRKLQAAKFVREHGGNVCPASWEPGKETLEPSMDLIGKI